MFTKPKNAYSLTHTIIWDILYCYSKTSHQKINNDQITQEHHETISSAVMQVRVIDTGVVLTSSGQIKVTAKIEATINKAEFKTKLKLLQEHKEKAEEVLVLNAQNKHLRDQLLKLSNAMTGSDHAWIQQERTSVIRRIDQNIKKSQQSLSFDSSVMLSQANIEREEAFKAVDDIINHLTNNVVVEISNPKVVTQGTGQSSVSIDYVYDTHGKKRFVGLLNRVFKDSYSDFKYMKKPRYERTKYPIHAFEIKRIWNKEGKGRTPYSGQALTKLQKKRVIIEFSIDGHNQVIQVPVASMPSAEEMRSFRGDKDYFIHLSHDLYPQLNNPRPETVTFNYVPEKLLKNRSSVKFEIKVI